MDVVKLQKLKHWRDNQAKKEGVDVYRVLSNQSLAEIVERNVKTEEDLLLVKGVKEKKLAKYGREILALMKAENISSDLNVPLGLIDEKISNNRPLTEVVEQTDTTDKVFSVSVFLDLVNTGLRTFEVKIKGEVTSMDERGNVYYFNLKDKTDGSSISCLIWKNNYRLSGVELKEGIEITVHGFPNVYKPSGRLSFQADTIELVGEGALKQQYEELKNKLEKEGLFSLERKKPIPMFLEKIGLITSRQGEAIFDVRNNLGKFGFRLKFFDSRVEGVQAVPSLLQAVRYFKDKDIDVLVLVRGGGSLESLLSFNNEALVREIADFPKPVVSGIGHEQDVSLVDLVADRSCSTPTGVAKFLSYSWEQALARVLLGEKQIFGSFRQALLIANSSVEKMAILIKDNFRLLLSSFRDLSYHLKNSLVNLGHFLSSSREHLKRASTYLLSILPKMFNQTNLRLETLAKAIFLNDPTRQLKMGYSLIYKQRSLVRSVDDVSQGDEITVQLPDGELSSKVVDKKKTL